MQGQCFPWAVQYARKHDDCTVCHGIVTAPFSAPPRRYVHAWVEHNGLVRDWQTMEAGHGGRFRGEGYPIDVFYELFKPERVLRYEPTDALVESVRHRHPGPWTEDFDDVISEQLERARREKQCSD